MGDELGCLKYKLSGGVLFRTCLLTLLPRLLQLNGARLGLYIGLLPLVLPPFWGCASDLPNSTDAQAWALQILESGFWGGTWEAEFSVHFHCRQSTCCQAQL